MIKHILSCDVGKEGALVLGRYEEGNLKILHTLSMPTSNKEKMEKISSWKDKYGIDIFIIEQQLGRSGNSAQANFTIGKNMGVLDCITSLLDLDVLTVYPQTWQTILRNVEAKELNQKLDISKRKSITLALDNFPSVVLAKKGRSKITYMDGIADAICIQLWYVNKYLVINEK